MNRIYNDVAKQTDLSNPSEVLPLTFIHRFIIFFTQLNKNFLVKNIHFILSQKISAQCRFSVFLVNMSGNFDKV